ncbi:MAG: sulfatase-like hydrolase/transferase [Pirellulaceae bacterium]
MNAQPHHPVASITFRVASIVAVLVSVCLTEPLLAEKPSADRPPNIVLIVTDDQGYWDTGVSGNEKIDTPAMDRLAKEGVTLDRFYASPVCSLTRAGLMTGRYYLRTGLYNTRFGGDTVSTAEVMLPQLLQKAGYRTGLFGKWHLGQYPGHQPHQRGFDEFMGHYHGHIERYSLPDQLVQNGQPAEARGYVADLFTDAALDFIQAESDQPFFCYLAFNTPHSPFLLDTTHFAQAEGDKLITKYLARGLPIREARIYAMVERIDQNVERLLEVLDEQGLSENTVVCFTGDNGGVSLGFNAGLRGRKASVYEGGVRVPFFVRWPDRIPAGKKLVTQTSHVDLLPTFCELAGAAVPQDRPIDGLSLMPLLSSGQEQPHHTHVYHTWDRYHPNPDRRWAVSDGVWKLMCQVGNEVENPADHWRLFNLKEDPGESNNQIKKHPEIATRLREEFLRWFEEVSEGQAFQPLPIPVGHPDQPEVEIQPSWATTEGENTRYVFEGYDWDTIEGWSQPGEKAVWRLDVRTAGRYEVSIRYGRPRVASKAKLRLRFGEGDDASQLICSPSATATPEVFIAQSVGQVTLPAGETSLTAEIIGEGQGEVIRLNHIRLRPVR